jgi:hypothetical protein
MSNSLIIILLLPFMIFLEEDIIKWKREKKLTWADYKAQPDTTGFTAAVTKCGISFSTVTSSYERYIFEVYATFESKKSWVWKKRASDTLLLHEQGHFDLTELYTRKFRKALSDSTFVISEIKTQIRKLFEVYVDSLNQRDFLYDKETRNSLNRKKQKEWTLQIMQELKTLEKYSGPYVTIYLKEE